MLTIAAFASSLRHESRNRWLLGHAVDALRTHEDVAVDVLDLRELRLPMYDADLQRSAGFPAEVQEIHDRIAASDAVVIANPEYNGGYPAVFKNLVDWVSRIDLLLFHTRYVGLLSVTPGRLGGVRGLEHTRSLFENMFVTTHPELLGIPNAKETMAADGTLDPEQQARVEAWAGDFVVGARAFQAARAEAAG